MHAAARHRDCPRSLKSACRDAPRAPAATAGNNFWLAGNMSKYEQALEPPLRLAGVYDRQRRPAMAHQPNPNDPYRRTDDEYRRAAALDSELQPDPELAEGPASGNRVVLF